MVERHVSIMANSFVESSDVPTNFTEHAQGSTQEAYGYLVCLQWRTARYLIQREAAHRWDTARYLFGVAVTVF